jgi:riboflavin-specific deaminase-like protein
MSTSDEEPIARPAVTIHYAQTLDGRIATCTGNSQWISGDSSLGLAHRLRAEHDAIMVGIGTVLADNPRLTVRLATGPSPMRIVADSTLRVPPDANVVTDGAAITLIATTERASCVRIEELNHAGVGVAVMRSDEEGRPDLDDLLSRLAAMGVRSLLVEGGGRLITSFLRRCLVDRLVICIAPKVLGTGIDAVGDLDIRRLSDALTFTESRFMPLGEDVIFDGTLNGRSGGSPSPSVRAADGDGAVVLGGADGRAPSGVVATTSA